MTQAVSAGGAGRQGPGGDFLPARDEHRGGGNRPLMRELVPQLIPYVRPMVTSVDRSELSGMGGRLRVSHTS